MNVPKDPQRAAIKARIATQQERERERSEMSMVERATDTAGEATSAFVDFVKERPLTAAVGGIALGVLVASMFRGPRRAAAAGGAKAAGLAALGAEIIGAFATGLADDATDLGRAGARRAENITEVVGDKARSVGRSATQRLGDAGDAARAARRETRKALARALGRR